MSSDQRWTLCGSFHVGPHIIIAPKSTVPNWFREFCKWCPSLRVVILQGDRANRAEVLNNQIRKRRFHVCITSYEIILRERSALSAIDWQYMIIDEAHRIKNEASALSTAVRQFSTKYRLLITGTPLQNNLHELWALLNFLMPDVFQSADLFDSDFKQTMEADLMHRFHSV